MKKTNKAKRTRWSFQDEHRQQILEALQSIIAKETSETVYTDVELTEMIRERGIYVTKTTMYNVRNAAGIGPVDQRRIELFAREHKKR